MLSALGSAYPTERQRGANNEEIQMKTLAALATLVLVGGLTTLAHAAIDVALWDIKGKALGVPVWNLLGGKVRDQIRIYAHANTPEAALSLKARGVTAIKCGGVSDPVRKVAALREAVGDEMDNMLDLH
eukprot:gene5544-7334_t